MRSLRIIFKVSTKMISETKLTELSTEYRSAVVSLRPKRRCKRSNGAQPEVKTKLAVQPVLSVMRKPRMHRSGRPNLILRRIISPEEFSRAMPYLPKSPLLRRVIDFLKLSPVVTKCHWGWARATASHRA
jgi:hypothetical protein